MMCPKWRSTGDRQRGLGKRINGGKGRMGPTQPQYNNPHEIRLEIAPQYRMLALLSCGWLDHGSRLGFAWSLQAHTTHDAHLAQGVRVQNVCV